MLHVFHVALHQRAVALRHGLPFKALGPGRHFIWGFGYSLERFDTNSLVFDMEPELRAPDARQAVDEDRNPNVVPGHAGRVARPEDMVGCLQGDGGGRLAVRTIHRLRAHRMVRGGLMIPSHWGLVDLAFHGWTEPAERVLAAATAAAVPIAIPKPGQSIEPAAPPAFERWWPEVPWETAEQDPIVATQVPAE